jgi:hypothetical protein
MLLWAGLYSVNASEAEAANEDVPKPPPNFSPGSLISPKPSAPKPSTGSVNSAPSKPGGSEGVTKGAEKPAGGGASRGR